MKAPNLYAITSAQLAEEMKRIDVAETMEWFGSTVITGVCRGDDLRPVTIIKGKGRGAMHMMSIPGGDY